MSPRFDPPLQRTVTRALRCRLSDRKRIAVQLRGSSNNENGGSIRRENPQPGSQRRVLLRHYHAGVGRKWPCSHVGQDVYHELLDAWVSARGAYPVAVQAPCELD